MKKYFPLGKAYGEAFCNRVAETAWLVENLQNARHSLLIAPRRYGKSSLAEKAITESKFKHIKLNFHLCTTEQEVAQLIVTNVVKLIGESVGQVEKIITSIKKYVSSLSPKLSFGGDMASLELIPKDQTNQAVVIAESLLLLNKLLKEKNKMAVMFFDEFQEITKIGKGTNIEGAIRTAAQEMQNLVIIFSGSIRSVLLNMFSDESRPLFKLCRKLKLERISAADYEKHLNQIAIERWNKKLDEPTFAMIMYLSNRHPYYVNYLCDIIWEENENLPTVGDVEKAWLTVIEEEWSDALREIASLSINQRKLLKFVVTHDAKNITSQEICLTLHLPASTIKSAISALVEKDYIEMNETGRYKVINPLLHSVLTERAE